MTDWQEDVQELLEVMSRERQKENTLDYTADVDIGEPDREAESGLDDELELTHSFNC